jgi:hypothetical protein
VLQAHRSASDSNLPATLLREIVANKATWLRWQRCGRLQVRQALALHHHFDPDALGFGRKHERSHDWKTLRCVLEQVRNVDTNIENNPIHCFALQLAFMGEYVRRGRIWCEAIAAPDSTASYTTVDHFIRFIGESPVLSVQEFPRHPAAPPPASSDKDPLKWQCGHSTELMLKLVEVSGLYRTVAAGGTYLPGHSETTPKVADHLVAQGVRRHVAEVMATILRPADLPKGRHPKKS